MKLEIWLAALVTDNLHIGPIDITYARPKRLAHRFFDGKAPRQSGWVILAISSLLSRKKALEEALAETMKSQ